MILHGEIVWHGLKKRTKLSRMSLSRKYEVLLAELNVVVSFLRKTIIKLSRVWWKGGSYWGGVYWENVGMRWCWQSCTYLVASFLCKTHRRKNCKTCIWFFKATSGHNYHYCSRNMVLFCERQMIKYKFTDSL